MQRANLLNHFRVNNRDVFLYLKPLAQNTVKSQCIDVPLIQEHELESLKSAFVQVYDYHRGQVNENKFVDATTYTIPKTCRVVEENQQFKHEKRLFSEVQENNGQGPLRVFDCPEDVEDSCPICKNHVDRRAEQSICKSDLASIVSRKPFHQRFYDAVMNKSDKEDKKKCVAVPLVVRRNANGKKPAVRHLHLFMLEKCDCAYVKEQAMGDGLVLVNKWTEDESKPLIHQLTNKDHLINLPLGRTNLPTCAAANKRSKRWALFTNEVEKLCPKEPTTCPHFEGTLTEALREKACKDFDIGM